MARTKPKVGGLARGDQAPRAADIDTPQRVSKIKKHRPGLGALKEIRKYQKSTNLLVPRLPFARLVREIMTQYSPFDSTPRIQAEALTALQEATEAYLVHLFEDA
eukprot:c2820_g1_i2.p1 GENE.c2820_g1_i2~~c2820_g1_i2.p1  ORF type:complete len:105 (+),score=13.05 c2820_g1_i2:25-339(+)